MIIGEVLEIFISIKTVILVEACLIINTDRNVMRPPPFLRNIKKIKRATIQNILISSLASISYQAICEKRFEKIALADHKLKTNKNFNHFLLSCLSLPDKMLTRKAVDSILKDLVEKIKKENIEFSWATIGWNDVEGATLAPKRPKCSSLNSRKS